jgi:leader peptidase (prepilin peptidase)/N-methyltransferase
MENAINPAIIFVLGLLIGSFLNVCVYRIPKNISILFPGSACPFCKKKLKWWHMIPVFSFFVLRGKCYFCKQNISWQYPLVELATGLIVFGLFYISESAGVFVFLSILLSSILVISTIDINFLIIPNKILLFMFLAGFTINIFTNVISWDTAFFGLFSSGSLLVMIRFTGNRILCQESLGWGDVKLGAVIGFYTGFAGFLMALVIGSSIAIFFMIMQFKNREIMSSYKIPLAPYLSVGVFLNLLLNYAYYQ